MGAPTLDRVAERTVGSEQALGEALLVAVEQAEHMLGGEPIVLFAGHARHSRRTVRERRIQDFTVPRGTPRRPASSPWVKPWI